MRRPGPQLPRKATASPRGDQAGAASVPCSCVSARGCCAVGRRQPQLGVAGTPRHEDRARTGVVVGHAVAGDRLDQPLRRRPRRRQPRDADVRAQQRIDEAAVGAHGGCAALQPQRHAAWPLLRCQRSSRRVSCCVVEKHQVLPVGGEGQAVQQVQAQRAESALHAAVQRGLVQVAACRRPGPGARRPGAGCRATRPAGGRPWPRAARCVRRRRPLPSGATRKSPPAPSASALKAMPAAVGRPVHAGREQRRARGQRTRRAVARAAGQPAAATACSGRRRPWR